MVFIWEGVTGERGARRRHREARCEEAPQGAGYEEAPPGSEVRRGLEMKKPTGWWAFRLAG